MTARLPYPEEQRTNLIEGLQSTLRRVAEDDDLSFDQSFIRVALDSLGFEFEEKSLSDGRGDFGVDYWTVEDRSANIFQFKSQDFEGTIDGSLVVGPHILTDIPRIMSLLENLDSVPKEANARTKDFLKELRSAIHRIDAAQSRDKPYAVSIFFVCLAHQLSPQAREELDALQKKTKLKWGSRFVEVSIIPILLDGLLAEHWRERNADWKTSAGTKDDRIELNVSGQMLESSKSLVFFTSAIDLVDAFNRFGYQIFEPNVRCELKRSRVNEAIKASVPSFRRGHEPAS